jgi:hypothetical protein
MVSMSVDFIVNLPVFVAFERCVSVRNQRESGDHARTGETYASETLVYLELDDLSLDDFSLFLNSNTDTPP